MFKIDSYYFKITRQTIHVALSILVLILGFVRCNYESTISISDNVDYNFDVKPILVQNCYLCHGPDPSSREAELRLDTYEGATALREEGRKAIFPGNPGKSELINRISHEDPELVMPPPKTNLKLSEYEIAVLKKWIDQGAKWEQHWSLITPRHDIPMRYDDQIAANEIDNYINQELEMNGMVPGPLADQNTLLRRVSYILTGLPPTPEMIEKFDKDHTPERYEKMVDHYLNSKSFGEHWARHWMDVVRYAETKGHEFDYAIAGAWEYRDYLIRAFNDDVPYDQLVKEHIAGDLLSEKRWNPDNGVNESHKGTMFFTFSEGKHSPVDTKKDEADRIDNMIDVTTKAFQGLTVSCARCHDHKFDPIPTKDYYSLYGVMQSSRFSPVSSNSSIKQMKYVKEIDSLKASIRKLISKRWEQKDLQNLQKAISRDIIENESKNKVPYKVLGDFRNQDLDGWKSDGIAFGDKSTLGDPVYEEHDGSLRFLDSGKASSKIYQKGLFGVLRSHNFTIKEDHIGIRALGNKSTIRIILNNFQLIQNPIYGELEQRVNSLELENLIFDVSPWKGQQAYIEIMPGLFEKHQYVLPKDAFIEAEYAIAFNHTWPDQVGNKIRPISTHENLISLWSSGNIGASQVTALNDLIRDKNLETQFPEIGDLLRSITNKADVHKDANFYSGIYDGFGRDSHVFNRGNTEDLSESTIPRGFLSALPNDHAFSSQGSGRLDLANVIVDPDNPLTSRVMVNRIWHHLFGRGIVETVDNFGLQGKLPSHPELLDHLSLKFVKEGWSIKKLIKYITMSHTFRRAVVKDHMTYDSDPENTLLAFYPIRRLEAESIHDALLAAAGNLNLEMYGPPVPVYLTEFMQGRGRPRISGPLDGNGRRNIYHEVRRNFLEPMMLTFDRPIPFTTFGKRNVTNVPAQSLALMNDPFVVAQAMEMAEDLIEQEALDEAERIKLVFIRTLSRLPTEEEINAALNYIQALSQTHETDRMDVSNSVDVWKDYCHAIFNMKEFIYLI